MFDVQITTEFSETIIIQVVASNPTEAEMTAISMVENGEAGTIGKRVVDCFCL